MITTRSATVVVSGDDVYEDLFEGAFALGQLLTDRGFVTRVRMGMASAVASCRTSDLLVLYTAVGEFSREQQETLSEAVADGLGLVAVHSTNVFSTRVDHDVASALIGSEFISHGAPPHESRFTVHVSGTSSHPLFTEPLEDELLDVEPFDVTHEHYEIVVGPDARVLAWRETAGSQNPLVYVRDHGAGRVAYVQLGHDLRSWGEPGVRAIVSRAAEWAARQEIAA